MAVYDENGIELSAVYDADGNELAKAYDADGSTIYEKNDPYIEGRTLLFEDTFDGHELNSDNWGYEIGNVRNNELQFYRSTNNVSVENSNLVITAKRESYLGKEWTSGSITGQNKKSWRYGRFEAKIKFPQIAGAFPAFWTMGANHILAYADEETGIKSDTSSGIPWAQCGENDIVEHYTGASQQVTCGGIYSTSSVSGQGTTNVGRVFKNIDLSVYHVYAIEWTETSMKYYIDGEEWSSFTITDAMATSFRNPHYILLNLAVGSTGGTPSSATNEMKMYVDWVRVYAPIES